VSPRGRLIKIGWCEGFVRDIDLVTFVLDVMLASLTLPADEIVRGRESTIAMVAGCKPTGTAGVRLGREALYGGAGGFIHSLSLAIIGKLDVGAAFGII